MNTPPRLSWREVLLAISMVVACLWLSFALMWTAFQGDESRLTQAIGVAVFWLLIDRTVRL